MKKETQIAKEYIKHIKDYKKEKGVISLSKGYAIKHKLSCQRFLLFLEEEYIMLDEMTFGIMDKLHSVRSNIYKKISDLKNAIKLYEENLK